MTGETANGRSISVISRLLPWNSNLAIAHAAAMPNSVFDRHDDRRREQRELDRGERVGILERSR